MADTNVTVTLDVDKDYTMDESDRIAQKACKVMLVALINHQQAMNKTKVIEGVLLVKVAQRLVQDLAVELFAENGQTFSTKEEAEIAAAEAEAKRREAA